MTFQNNQLFIIQICSYTDVYIFLKIQDSIHFVVTLSMKQSLALQMFFFIGAKHFLIINALIISITNRMEIYLSVLFDLLILLAYHNHRSAYLSKILTLTYGFNFTIVTKSFNILILHEFKNIFVFFYELNTCKCYSCLII